MVSTQHESMVRRVVDEIWNRGDLDLADELFARRYINHGGLITDLVRGPEAVKVSVAMLRRAFPALSITIDELRVDGAFTLLRWTSHGLRPIRRQGLGPVGPDRLAGVTHCRIAGGKIEESWIIWDQGAAPCRLDLAGSPPLLA